jgi:hypothetical protein
MRFKEFLQESKKFKLPERGELIAFEDEVKIGSYKIQPNTELEVQTSDDTQIGLSYKGKTAYFTTKELEHFGMYLV